MPTLLPSTAFDRGPAEEPIVLDPSDRETIGEAGGDSSGIDLDANVGGAPASAGLDSGGAVGVRRGLSVGRSGASYEQAVRGETTSDVDGPLPQVDDEDEGETEGALPDE